MAPQLRVSILQSTVYRRPSFSSQHPCLTANNYLYFQLWGVLTPLAFKRAALACTEPHTETHNYTQISRHKSFFKANSCLYVGIYACVGSHLPPHGPQGLNSDQEAQGQVPFPCPACPKAQRILSHSVLRTQHRTRQKSSVIYRHIFTSRESFSLETREVPR